MILTFVRMTATGSARRIRQDDDSRAVIPDSIRNRCYCQKTVDPDFRQDDGYLKNADPDFRQDDGYGTTGIILPASWRIKSEKQL